MDEGILMSLSTLPGDKRDAMESSSTVYMMDIALKHTDTLRSHSPSLRLKKIQVFGFPGFEEGKCFDLVRSRTSPRRWMLRGCIELHSDVHEIKCVIKSDEDEDVALGRVNYTHARAGARKNTVICKGQLHSYSLSWKLVHWIALKGSLPKEGRFEQLSVLGLSFVDRFIETGNILYIDEAVTALRRVLQPTPDGHRYRPTRLTNLGMALSTRFRCTGKLEDLTDTILLQRRAVELTPDGHIPLNNLGVSLYDRFRRTGEIADLTESISHQRRATALTPENHSDLPIRLNNLGFLLSSRFGRTEDLADLTEAIMLQRRAVELTPESHPDLPTRLNNIGLSLSSRFSRTANLEDLTEAISLQRRAVGLTPDGHSYIHILLNNLGFFLSSRFDRTGNLEDLTETVLLERRAVDNTPEDHADLPSRLNNLGSTLYSRFRRAGELTDLIEAISLRRRALQLSPDGHPNIPILLSNLGFLLTSCFDQTGNLEDVTEAISLQRRAVELTPDGHPDLPTRLGNLGLSLFVCFRHTGVLKDLTEAISLQRRAVELAPDNHTDLPKWLTNLGRSLSDRCDRTGDVEDLTEAISLQGKAVELTPHGHSDLPIWLLNLGSRTLARFEHASRSAVMDPEAAASTEATSADPTPDNLDLNASITAFESAATCNFGSPSSRLRAAVQWIKVLQQYSPRTPKILDAFRSGLTVLALLAGLEQTVRGRYVQIREYGDLPLNAASAACSFGEPDTALEWLEQGRCLVWGQLLNLRTPLDALRMQNINLADRIGAVSRKLEVASSRGSSYPDMPPSARRSLEEEAHAQVILARERDELIESARSIPGLDSFFQPTPYSTLREHLPALGVVIVINVGDKRCDAIVLVAGHDRPVHVYLPEFSRDRANKYRRFLETGFQQEGIRVRYKEDTGDERALRPHIPNRKHVVRDVLQGLWKEVVQPIFAALRLSKLDHSSEENPPRIWWCPTGPLSFLPIHAAGVYANEGSESDCVLDYAVSSYIPTVTALTDRVKNSRPIDKEFSGLFLTSHPSAVRASPIPGTTSEVKSIYARAEKSGVRALKVEGDDITIDECLKHMEEFSSVHFACHASQNAADPLESRFFFHQGPLSLSTILQQNLKNADLAFLSACQTSTGEETLPNEAVHLAAGMLAAGYRRVVATMWAIGDEPAKEIANDFYDYLWSHRDESTGSCFDGTLSAYALHHAIQQFRRRPKNSKTSALTWAPFVHFGY